ncbi:hypothetical protein AKL22_07345 [Carnobacterium maltaromaticum]|nr:hypothetical protein [Carnobacterium maltaromaticum]
MAKSAISIFLIFLPELIDSTNFFIQASSFESDLRKKDKFPKKQRDTFLGISYFSARSNRLNKLFIQASSFEPTPREKDKNSKWQKAPYQFFLFSCRS